MAWDSGLPWAWECPRVSGEVDFLPAQGGTRVTLHAGLLTQTWGQRRDPAAIPVTAGWPGMLEELAGPPSVAQRRAAR